MFNAFVIFSVRFILLRFMLAALCHYIIRDYGYYASLMRAL